MKSIDLTQSILKWNEEQLESLKTKNSDLTTQINNLNSKVESLKTNKILENNLKEKK